MIALGQEVWVNPASPAPHTRRLSRFRPLRLLQIRGMDVLYMRMQGHYPAALPAFLLPPWSAFYQRLPLVWEVNSASDLADLTPQAGAALPSGRLDDIHRVNARRVSLAVCNTEGLAQYARDLGIPRAQTIPLASDPDLFHPAAAPAAEIPRGAGLFNVLWCGNATVAWHDFEIIHQAARRLAAVPQIRFYLAGEPPPGVALPPNIAVLGPKPYSAMPGLMAAMDAGLATYKRPDWSRYGVFSSPLKLFDYMASGLAVLSSPIEQACRCLEDGVSGYLIPFGDDEALAARLLDIHRNPAAAAPVRQRARQLVVDYYNWRRVAAETLAAIQPLIPHG